MQLAAEGVEYRCCAFDHPHQPVLQQIRLLTGLNVVGETHNTAFQLVLPQCRKTSCTFSFRLRAVSLFCSPSSKTRDTQMATRVTTAALVSRVSQLRRSRARALLFRCPFYRSFRWHCRQNNSLSSEKVEWKVLSIGYRFIQWMVLSIFCTTEA